MRITPINEEAVFGPDELFFSRTDEKGIIASGNDVFVRVSGHSRARLVGSPHNIIRHPDMPKAVFKLLWQEILAGRPICAYVKNMASDGRYYWVLATVFPLGGGQGFLSVRLKPSTRYFSIVRELYPVVLEKERKEGPDAALQLLQEKLEGLGFSGYGSFMSRVLVAEVQARGSTESATKPGRPKVGPSSGLSEMARLCETNSTLTASIFSRLEDFSAINSDVSERSEFALRSFKQLDLLAINMSTAAKRLGAEGVTLVAVANGITKSAMEFKAALQAFRATAKSVGVALDAAAFEIAAARLQVDMIRFYVAETLSKANVAEAGRADLGEMKLNARLLLGLSSASLRTLRETMVELRTLLESVAGDAETLRGTINGVEIIRKTGVIEAAQLATGSDEFRTFFRSMNDLVRETSGKMGTFGDSVRHSLDSIRAILPTLDEIAQVVSNIGTQNEDLPV